MSVCSKKINGAFFRMIFVMIENELRNLNAIQVSPHYMQGFTQNKRLFQELKSILVSRLRPHERPIPRTCTQSQHNGTIYAVLSGMSSSRSNLIKMIK